MLVAESRIVGVVDFVKAVTKILSSRTKYQFGVRDMAVYWKSGYRVGVSRVVKAVAKIMKSRTLYQIGIRSVAVSEKADTESE